MTKKSFKSIYRAALESGELANLILAAVEEKAEKPIENDSNASIKFYKTIREKVESFYLELSILTEGELQKCVEMLADSLTYAPGSVLLRHVPDAEKMAASMEKIQHERLLDQKTAVIKDTKKQQTEILSVVPGKKTKLKVLEARAQQLIALSKQESTLQKEVDMLTDTGIQLVTREAFCNAINSKGNTLRTLGELPVLDTSGDKVAINAGGDLNKMTDLAFIEALTLTLQEKWVETKLATGAKDATRAIEDVYYMEAVKSLVSAVWTSFSQQHNPLMPPESQLEAADRHSGRVQKYASLLNTTFKGIKEEIDGKPPFFSAEAHGALSAEITAIEERVGTFFSTVYPKDYGASQKTSQYINGVMVKIHTQFAADSIQHFNEAKKGLVSNIKGDVVEAQASGLIANDIGNTTMDKMFGDVVKGLEARNNLINMLCFTDLGKNDTPDPRQLRQLLNFYEDIWVMPHPDPVTQIRAYCDKHPELMGLYPSLQKNLIRFVTTGAYAAIASSPDMSIEIVQQPESSSKAGKKEAKHQGNLRQPAVTYSVAGMTEDMLDLSDSQVERPKREVTPKIHRKRKLVAGEKKQEISDIKPKEEEPAVFGNGSDTVAVSPGFAEKLDLERKPLSVLPPPKRQNSSYSQHIEEERSNPKAKGFGRGLSSSSGNDE